MATAAVNKPTDVKARDKDVNAKLQLYGIYAAFAQGKVPSVSLHCPATRPEFQLTDHHARTNKSMLP